ncbi:MAG: trimeric intracellular cation channel family protein [Gammaproteobacteria bacterium]|nr:MAG: trimeric intracellular cation channel family protein [Gammaproteobacteria bacterium]
MFLDTLYWITLIAVLVSSASGVLQATGRHQFDLFGVLMIAVATGLGGGSLRDVLLGREVFWVMDQSFFIASVLSALILFGIASTRKISPRVFLIPDAAGLATFTIAGTLVADMQGAGMLIASFMGVVTGIMGGVLRDVLCGVPPIVFNSPLYATVAWCGALLLLALQGIGLSDELAAGLVGVIVFAGRLLALRFQIGLPSLKSCPKDQ